MIWIFTLKENNLQTWLISSLNTRTTIGQINVHPGVARAVVWSKESFRNTKGFISVQSSKYHTVQSSIQRQRNNHGDDDSIVGVRLERRSSDWCLSVPYHHSYVCWDLHLSIHISLHLTDTITITLGMTRASSLNVRYDKLSLVVAQYQNESWYTVEV